MISAATPQTPPQTVVTSRHSSLTPPDADLPNEISDKYTRLSIGLRAKLGKVTDTVTLATVGDYLKYKRTLLFSQTIALIVRNKI